MHLRSDCFEKWFTNVLLLVAIMKTIERFAAETGARFAAETDASFCTQFGNADVDP